MATKISKTQYCMKNMYQLMLNIVLLLQFKARFSVNLARQHQSEHLNNIKNDEQQ